MPSESRPRRRHPTTRFPNDTPVESRRGAVAWSLWASLRFLSPLIKPDVRISRIRLPDRLHLKAHGGGPRWTRRSRITPSSPNTTLSGKRLVPRDDTLWRLTRKSTNSLVDRVVDGPVSRHSRPMVEVVRPTAQHAVQLIAHLGPGGVAMPGPSTVAHLRLEPGNAPLGRARPQVPVAILAKPMRAEAVAQEVEALLAGLTHAGLRLVQGQASRPITCRVQARASLACPRERMTKSSA